MGALRIQILDLDDGASTKRFLITVLLSGASMPAFGQGWAMFRNYYTATTPSINAPIYLGVVGGEKLDSAVNSLWRAALLGGPNHGYSRFRARQFAITSSWPACGWRFKPDLLCVQHNEADSAVAHPKL